MLGQHGADRNAEATVYVGNLDTQVTEELLWELFLQAGPVTNVYVPKDRVTSTHQGFGFVEFRSEEDAEYVRRRDATRTLVNENARAMTMMIKISALLMSSGS